jgi:dTDP-4-dehydrorhamnose reductase
MPIKVRDIRPIGTEDYPLPAQRPANSVFDKTKYKTFTGAEIPAWRDSLHDYFLSRV